MKNKIFFIIFMSIWVTLIVFNFLVPNKAFSEQENRYLATVPKFNNNDLVSGKYAEDLDTYINDHFVGRNFWLKFNSFVQIASGKTENNGVYIGKEDFLFEKFVYGEEEEKNLEKISNSVNAFSKNKQIPIYFMLVPNSIYIYNEKLPNNVEVYDQGKIINDFYEKLKSPTKTIDVTDILLENKNTRQLYFRTDHHITSAGAYLLYEKFCDTVGENSVALNELEHKIISEDFLGTIDSKAQVYNQKTDTMDVYLNSINLNIEGNYDGKTYNSMFNESFLEGKDKYSYYLNGNNAKVIIKTKVNNGKKLLILKDSYAHIFSQFICQNYEEVHFIDPRYYKLSITEYMEKNNISEVLFLYNVSNMVTDLSLRGIK